LARKLGARIRRCKTREIGIYHVTLTQHGVKDPLFSGFPEVFPVFQWHLDMFEVSHGGEILVRGELCPIQGFGYRNIRGLIFHLEIDTNEATRWTEAYPSGLQSTNKTKNSVKSAKNMRLR